MKKLILLATFVAMQLSWAGTVTTTGTFTQTDFPFSGNIAVDAFDTTLGTLTGITISLEGWAIDVTYTLTNDDDSAATLSDDSLGGVRMRLWGPVGSGADPLAIVFPALVIPQSDPAFPLAPTESVSVGPGSDYESDPNNVVPAGIWSLFTNNGACADCILLPVTGVPYYSLVAEGGTLTPTPTGQGSAQATVVYTYDSPVPEPAMLSLVGGGLLGLGFVARRRKKA